MNEIGHNKPPDMAVTAGEVTQDLSQWMAEHPVIETEEDARAAKVYNDRGVLCIKDLEDERKGKVTPLNEEVARINETYKGPRNLLEKVLDELKMRIGRFLNSEEARLRKIAEQRRALAEDAERLAKEAERVEQEALASAASGELDVNVADVTGSADTAFADYQKAERQAQIAERDTRVKVKGLLRSEGMKSRTIVEVADPIAFLSHMGVGWYNGNEDAKKAFRVAAKQYKAVHGKWPPGVMVTIERSM